jgi:zinc transport system substrate-binding protein
MRVRIIFILIGLAVAGVLIAVFAFGGDSKGSSKGSGSIVAAFYPLAYAAEQLEPNANVVNLTPAGAEPHDLELTPGDVTKVKDASFVLLMGHGFQPQLERAVEDSEARVLTLLDTPGLERRSNDPHVWLDPVRYALLVQTIGRALHAEDAAARMVVRLHALDREYRVGLAHCARHEIVTSHAAFGYLSQRYGLTQVSVEGLAPEAEPAPRDLARVVDLVRKDGVTTVYAETLVSPKLAHTIARETGAKSAVLDPIEGLIPRAIATGADYFTVMRANLAALRQGLDCR